MFMLQIQVIYLLLFYKLVMLINHLWFDENKVGAKKIKQKYLWLIRREGKGMDLRTIYVELWRFDTLEIIEWTCIVDFRSIVNWTRLEYLQVFGPMMLNEELPWTIG